MLELKTRQLRGTSDGPHLLITAGVHGDGFEGIAAAQLMRRMVATELRGRVTLVPVVNESAFDQRSRCGTDGLDLARTCPEKSDGSVTEQAAAALVQLIQAVDLYIDLHSGKHSKISAAKSGAAVVLRTYPRVDLADSLAAVLKDTDELPPCC